MIYRSGSVIADVIRLQLRTNMSFYTPEFGIKHYDEIPVLCSNCDSQSTWRELSQSTKEALISSTSLHSLTREHKFLKRLQDLCDAFPDTKHPLIHNKRRKRDGNPEADARVEHVLNNDPELRDFLTKSGFDIAARLPFVEKRISELRFASGRHDIACKKCGNYSYLPNKFLMEVGSYLERLGENGG